MGWEMRRISVCIFWMDHNYAETPDQPRVWWIKYWCIEELIWILYVSQPRGNSRPIKGLMNNVLGWIEQWWEEEKEMMEPWYYHGLTHIHALSLQLFHIYSVRLLHRKGSCYSNKLVCTTHIKHFSIFRRGRSDTSKLSSSSLYIRKGRKIV